MSESSSPVIGSPSGADVPVEAEEHARMRRELVLLRTRVRRLERQVTSLQPLIDHVRTLRFWDYTPYAVTPGRDWVAVDRLGAEELLAALAETDLWEPWRTPIDPRPPQ
ncbi:hypothetical protein [Gordonia sp. NPDC003376]